MKLSETLEKSVNIHYEITKGRRKFEKLKKNTLLFTIGITYLLGVRTLPIICYNNYLEKASEQTEQIYEYKLDETNN